MNDLERIERLAAAAALRVESGMTLGLGSGSTAEAVIRAIGHRIRTEGLLVSGVPTSCRTEMLARHEGIELVELVSGLRLELGFDGADEIDPHLNLVKGRGGALLYEKIVALVCDEWIIVASDEKLVKRLGSRIRLPVEVIPFGWEATAILVSEVAGEVQLRLHPDGSQFLTDCGHLILDCATGLIADSTALDHALKQIPGVVDHGLFIGLASEAMVIDQEGEIQILPEQ